MENIFPEATIYRWRKNKKGRKFKKEGIIS